jgi:hypothetical protein
MQLQANGRAESVSHEVSCEIELSYEETRRYLFPLSPCGRACLRCEASQTGEGSLSADADPLIRRGLRIADAKHRRPIKERRPKAAYGHLLPQGETEVEGAPHLFTKDNTP